MSHEGSKGGSLTDTRADVREIERELDEVCAGIIAERQSGATPEQDAEIKEEKADLAVTAGDLDTEGFHS